MASDLRTKDIQNPIDVAEVSWPTFTCHCYAEQSYQYLFRRLHEVGVRSVHGLPGDYNLVALDYIPKVGLNWVGNCNELNAGERPWSYPA